MKRVLQIERFAYGYEPKPLRWLPGVSYRQFDGHDEFYISEAWSTVLVVVFFAAVAVGAFLLVNIAEQHGYELGVRSQQQR